MWPLHMLLYVLQVTDMSMLNTTSMDNTAVSFYSTETSELIKVGYKVYFRVSSGNVQQ